MMRTHAAASDGLPRRRDGSFRSITAAMSHRRRAIGLSGARRHRVCSFDLALQIVDDAFKRIEAESLSNRQAEVRIRVYIVKDQLAIDCLKILDSSDVETAGCHDLA